MVQADPEFSPPFAPPERDEKQRAKDPDHVAHPAAVVR